MAIKPTRDSSLARLARGRKTMQENRTPVTGDIWNDWLRPELDRALEQEETFWKPSVQYLRGRTLGLECERAMAFDMFGHRVPFTAKKLRIFRTGRAIEKEIIDNIKKTPLFLEEDVKLTYEVPTVVGRADVFIARRTDGKRICVEVKSINSNGFRRLPREHGPTLAGQSPLLAIKRGYVMQLNTYLGADNSETDEGVFLFENKDDSEQKSYHIIFDPDLLSKQLMLGGITQTYVKDEILPSVPLSRRPRGEDKVCSWCDHRTLCAKLSQNFVTLDEVKATDAELRG